MVLTRGITRECVPVVRRFMLINPDPESSAIILRPLHHSSTYNVTLLSFASLSCRKEIPLLDLISRGTNLSTQEASVITPLLSLFSALLSNTLFFVRDNEFYGPEGITLYTR